MSKIAILLPSGVFQESNFQYKRYIDKGLQKIAEYQPDILFIPGGHTNKDLPDLSEAQSIFDYVGKTYPQLTEKVLLEENSLTTFENFIFIKEIIQEKKIEITELFIISDSIRIIKVYLLTTHLFKDLLQITDSEEQILESLLDQGLAGNVKPPHNSFLQFHTMVIDGIDLERSPEEIGAQIGATVLEEHYLEYPKLHQKAVEFRIKQLGLKDIVKRS